MVRDQAAGLLVGSVSSRQGYLQTFWTRRHGVTDDYFYVYTYDFSRPGYGFDMGWMMYASTASSGTQSRHHVLCR